MPITYFGSAWATLGLVRFVPPPIDLATRQQRAIDAIRMYGGTHDVDENIAGKPVVKVKIVYEVDDQELAQLVDLLTAFPELRSLTFKSARISDAGLTHLQNLPELRSLSLENAAVTDVGLASLTRLARLEELVLKGTQVTDAGVREFQTRQGQIRIAR